MIHSNIENSENLQKSVKRLFLGTKHSAKNYYFYTMIPWNCAAIEMHSHGGGEAVNVVYKGTLLFLEVIPRCTP